MTDKASEIAALLAPTVESLGLELLGAEYLPAPGSATLRLYIDVPANAEEGRLVGIEDCEAVSREVSAQLDVEDPITGNYTLEVSSPGIDRPLRTRAHFARYAGAEVKIQLAVPQQTPSGERRNYKGALIGVEGDAAATLVVVEVDGTVHKLPLGDIDTARIVPDWDDVMRGGTGIVARNAPGPGKGKQKSSKAARA